MYFAGPDYIYALQTLYLKVSEQSNPKTEKDIEEKKYELKWTMKPSWGMVSYYCILHSSGLKGLH